MKKYLIGFVFGLIIAGSIGVLATVAASSITYNGTTVDRVLDDLYSKANQARVYCVLMEGTGKTLGAKYYCDPGDGTYRYFYVLKVNTNDVELIMDRNISDSVGSSATMSWNDAMVFFTTGAGKDLSWSNAISVDIPSAQEIADAGGISNFNQENAYIYYSESANGRSNYEWLYNYTRGCSSHGCSNSYNENDNTKAFGYWTSSKVNNDETTAWVSIRNGRLEKYSINHSTDNGVRPVIKMSKSNLSS